MTATRDTARASLLDAARVSWLRGDRVELTTLAAEHGISRATAYRWFGSNQQLTAELITEVLIETFEWARSTARGRGSSRVVDTLANHLRATMRSGAVRAFIDRDPPGALAILTTGDFQVQRTFTNLIRELLLEEVEQSRLDLRVDANVLAYALTRLMEAFAYADVVAGQPRDYEAAVEVLRCLFSSN